MSRGNEGKMGGTRWEKLEGTMTGTPDVYWRRNIFFDLSHVTSTSCDVEMAADVWLGTIWVPKCGDLFVS